MQNVKPATTPINIRQLLDNDRFLFLDRYPLFSGFEPLPLMAEAQRLPSPEMPLSDLDRPVFESR